MRDHSIRFITEKSFIGGTFVPWNFRSLTLIIRPILYTGFDALLGDVWMCGSADVTTGKRRMLMRRTSAFYLSYSAMPLDQ